nr:hypothetical protein [Kofleriaceae bacterium]
GWGYGCLLVTGVAMSASGAVGVGAGCTKQNPNVCCISELDCAAIGIPADSSCQSGFACTNHECIEATCVVDADCTDPAAAFCGDGLCRECTASGQCPASAAVCNLTTNGCERCLADTDCSSFAATPHCAANGACAECASNLDCGATEPVCGTDGSCRTCEHDAECASGACDASGTCVVSSAVIYIAPTGIDAGGCVQSQPCLTPGFAVALVTPARFHISMAPGQYTGQLVGSAAAPRISVHGNGAMITNSGTAAVPTINVDRNKVFVRDLTINAPDQAYGFECKNNGEVDLRAVDVVHPGISYSGGVANACKVTWQDSSARAISISTNSELTLRRMRFIDSQAVSSIDSTVTIENVAVLRASDYPFNFTRTQGAASFVTVADSAPGHGGFNCIASPVQITNSVIWVPNVGNFSDRPILGNCVATGQNLLGPLTPATPTSVDPLFVDMANGDLHLMPTSLGVDKADTGPLTDVLGAARPLGAKFDLGAFESH